MVVYGRFTKGYGFIYVRRGSSSNHGCRKVGSDTSCQVLGNLVMDKKKNGKEKKNESYFKQDCLEYPITRRNRPTRLEPTRHDWNDTSDGSVTSPNLQNPTSVGRVAGSVLKNPIYLTYPTKPQKEGRNPTTFGLLSSDQATFGLPLLR